MTQRAAWFTRDADSPRTDLAVEAPRVHEGIPGVEVQRRGDDEVGVTDVRITQESAARMVGKPVGRYVTIEASGLRERNRAEQQRVTDLLASELASFLPADVQALALVVGLGNWRATPDALGPRVVREVLVTRQLREFVPEDLRGKLRPVCALAPGVLGITGIETGEIIKGVVDRLKPDVVVAVDSLTAGSVSRVLTTIQLTDTGIQPGSGVTGGRTGVTRDLLGVPVVAIGVPTVVHAATIAAEAVDALARELDDHRFEELLEEMQLPGKRYAVEDALSSVAKGLMVTPKEIDVYVQETSEMVASGLNAALHPDLDLEELSTHAH